LNYDYERPDVDPLPQDSVTLRVYETPLKKPGGLQKIGGLYLSY